MVGAFEELKLSGHMIPETVRWMDSSERLVTRTYIFYCYCPEAAYELDLSWRMILQAVYQLDFAD